MDVKFDLIFRDNEIRAVSENGRKFVELHGTETMPENYKLAMDASLSVSVESLTELERLKGAVTA